MNITEHLLEVIAEECIETAQRALKAQRFGIREVKPEQDKNNYDRMMIEFTEIVAVLEMLVEHEALPRWSEDRARVLIDAKKEKVKKYMVWAESQGALKRV